jgi:hypothetical protein
MSAQATDVPLCRRCGRPVRVNRERYDIFEQMHWICFHFEFEHTLEFDPDEPCADPSCPWRRIAELDKAPRREEP